MIIKNYEGGKYKTLSFSDFCTTEVFDYETAFLKENTGLNMYVIKKGITLSSKSKMINWKKLKWDISKKHYLSNMRITHNLNPGCYRKLIHGNDFYLAKARDNYIEDIKTFYNIFNKNGVNKKLIYYFSGTSCGWPLALTKATSFIKNYLNGWADEKIELYYKYAYHKWSQTKNVYIHQSIKGGLPHVFFDFRQIKTFAQVQKEQMKNIMTTKQMRQSLLDGNILCFNVKGLNIEIKPPIKQNSGSYDFSYSIFINKKPLNTLDIKSNEYITWKQNNLKFKEHLYELISSKKDITFSTDVNRELAKYIYNIKKPSIIIKKEPTKKQVSIIKEWEETEKILDQFLVSPLQTNKELITHAFNYKRFNPKYELDFWSIYAIRNCEYKFKSIKWERIITNAYSQKEALDYINKLFGNSIIRILCAPVKFDKKQIPTKEIEILFSNESSPRKYKLRDNETHQMFKLKLRTLAYRKDVLKNIKE